MVIKILILAHYKQSLKINVEIDFFDYISNGVFFQLRGHNLQYPIVFFLKNLNLIEYNYEIFDQKRLTFI